MRFARSLFLLPLAFALALLTGCGKHESPAESAGTPGEAETASLELLHKGQFTAFWEHALPPADLRNLRQDWNLPDPAQAPVTDADRKKFADMAQRLTGPDAEKKLFAELRPKLVQFDKEYRDQLPLVAGILQSMALTAIDQAKSFDHARKQQARDVLAIVAPWAQQVPWGDQAKARQAIAILTDTARKLSPSTLDRWQALDFDTSMTRCATAWDGLKRLLAVYGLSLDESFDSVSIQTLEANDSSAHLRIDYTLLGKPLTTEATMVRLDGRWYDADLLAGARARHARLTPPAPAPVALPASAATVPATTSTAAH
jgi:hypothetical protein